MTLDLLLDSGAYSAFTRGVEINVKDYIAFLHAHPYLTNYISLDHIPGAYGVRVHDPRAAEWTYRNHQIMKDAGLIPLPVFHRQDEPVWLERYLKDGELRIALAPLPMRQREVIAWFQRCFSLIPPTTRVHGLGTTVASMLRYFPFDSVDSTSWIVQAKTYHVKVPVFDGRGFDYRHHPHGIAVSDQLSRRPNHFNNLDPLLKQQADGFFAECGTSLEELRVSMLARRRVTIRYYQGLAAVANVKLHFVSGLNDESLVEALRQCGVRSQLLSYAQLKDNPAGMISYLWRKW